jgi:hypothetical protein
MRPAVGRIGRRSTVIGGGSDSVYDPFHHCFAQATGRVVILGRVVLAKHIKGMQ